MNLTYKDLKDFLETLTAEQLACNVSVYTGLYSRDTDEAYPVFAAGFNTTEEMGEELDTLDSGHPILLL
jgi:hypothetical protein